MWCIWYWIKGWVELRDGIELRDGVKRWCELRDGVELRGGVELRDGMKGHTKTEMTNFWTTRCFLKAKCILWTLGDRKGKYMRNVSKQRPFVHLKLLKMRWYELRDGIELRDGLN